MENYWWVFLVIVLIIILVILVICLAWTNISEPCDKSGCPSAEYPTIAENTSDDPNIVEVTLTSSDNEVQVLSGDLTKMYNYNMSFPGPLIEAKRGDLLIVHFVNDISEPSTITFHGLMPDADEDGSELAQHPVQPGDCWTYKIRLTASGLFYYHSDVDSRRQVSMGLFGAILVHDYDEDHRCRLPLSEKVLAFSDLKLDGNNQIDIEYSQDETTRILQQLNGIRGNVLLTNGVHNGCIRLSRNVPVRLRMLNAAVDRFLKIYVGDHDILKIGGDQGLASKPLLIKAGHGLLLSPGERADIVFVPRTERIELATELDPRGTQQVKTDSCGNLEIENQVDYNTEKAVLVTFITRDESEQKLEVPLQLEPIKKIRVDRCTPIIPVNYGYYECGNDLSYYAVRKNGQGIPFNSLTPKQAPIVFEDGVYIIEVSNYSDLANNFHLHGFTFQHIDTWSVSKTGKQVIFNPVIENKDTIVIPARPQSGTKTVVRLAVEFRGKNRDIIAYGGYPTTIDKGRCKKTRSGGWVFQSHLLTNEELGQAGYIQIVSECYRERYIDSAASSYSEYFSGDHSTCLTHSLRGSTSESYDEPSLSDIESLTKSLIVCSCGSGLSTEQCSCIDTSTSLSY